jgi:hypothetical protein
LVSDSEVRIAGTLLGVNRISPQGESRGEKFFIQNPQNVALRLDFCRARPAAGLTV